MTYSRPIQSLTIARNWQERWNFQKSHRISFDRKLCAWNGQELLIPLLIPTSLVLIFSRFVLLSMHPWKSLFLFQLLAVKGIHRWRTESNISRCRRFIEEGTPIISTRKEENLEEVSRLIISFQTQITCENSSYPYRLAQNAWGIFWSPIE